MNIFGAIAWSPEIAGKSILEVSSIVLDAMNKNVSLAEGGVALPYLMAMRSAAFRAMFTMVLCRVDVTVPPVRA